MPNTFATHNTNPLTQYPQAWERAGKVKLLVLDVDGVLTNGQVWIGADGKETLKAFDIQDGLGIKLLEQCGISTAIITGRNSKMVLGRCEELGIKHVHMGVDNKAIALEEILKTLGLDSKDCAVMGDDWPDFQMMKNAGFRVCPAQGHEAVKEFAHFVSSRTGGSGAVREVCDLILKAQGRYNALLIEART
jgi:3-deoxy-D-manno-octulosonate 8-phosphate phosphatase (KDO 8-P phosphatase)